MDIASLSCWPAPRILCLAQNYARLCQDLDAQRPGITPFRNPQPQDAEVIQGVLHGQGHALIVILKNRGRLDDVRRLIG